MQIDLNGRNIRELSDTLVYIENVLDQINSGALKKNDVLTGFNENTFDLPPSKYKRKYQEIFLECVQYGGKIKAKIIEKKNIIEIKRIK